MRRGTSNCEAGVRCFRRGISWQNFSARVRLTCTRINGRGVINVREKFATMRCTDGRCSRLPGVNRRPFGKVYRPHCDKRTLPRSWPGLLRRESLKRVSKRRRRYTREPWSVTSFNDREYARILFENVSRKDLRYPVRYSMSINWL